MILTNYDKELDDKVKDKLRHYIDEIDQGNKLTNVELLYIIDHLNYEIFPYLQEKSLSKSTVNL